MTTTPTRWLDPFQVDGASIGGTQSDQRILGLSNGNILALYTDTAGTVGSGTGSDIVGVLYDAVGNVIRAPWQVNTLYEFGDQSVEDVVAMGDGGFTLLYRNDAASGALQLERFDADGDTTAASTSEVVSVAVSTPTLTIREGEIGRDAGDDSLFVTFRTSFANGTSDIKGIAYDATLTPATGTPVGGQVVRWSAPGAEMPGHPDTIALLSGVYVTAFSKNLSAVQSDSLLLAVSNLLSGELASFVEIPTTPDSLVAFDPKLTSLRFGGGVVVWEEEGVPSTQRIKFAIFDETVSFTSGSRTLALTGTTNWNDPEVIALADGGFFIAAKAANTAVGRIDGWRYDRDGLLIGSRTFQMESPVDGGFDLSPSSDGRILATWTSGGDLFSSIWDPRDTEIIATGMPGTYTARLTDNTTLIGSSADETLIGFSGRDTISGGDGNDTMEGGFGTLDWVDYSYRAPLGPIPANTGMVIDLRLGYATFIEEALPVENDVLSGFENVIGSGYDDIIIGDEGHNEVIGAVGNDTIRGGEGDDTAILIGAAKDYATRRDTDGVVYVEQIDITFRDEGLDKLYDVETVRFSDTSRSSDALVDTFGFAEVGTIELTHALTTITLQRSYENPVVVAFVATENGVQPVHTRIRSVEGDQLRIGLREPNHLDGRHQAETVHYMVVDEGSWILPNGQLLEAGLLDTSKLSTQGFETVLFDSEFDTAPIVLSHVQTFNGSDFVVTRNRDVTVDSMEITMQEEEALNSGAHASESLGWIAMSRTSDEAIGSVAGLTWTASNQVGITDATSAFDLSLGSIDPAEAIIIAGLSTFAGSDPAWVRGTGPNGADFDLSVEEEKSRDAEITHAAETVDAFVFSQAGTLPALPKQLVLYAGSAEVTDAQSRIVLPAAFEDPVVVAFVATVNGAQPVNARIDSVMPNYFDLELQEPNYLDGTHGVETVNYLVVERGVWRLPDGTLLEAGTLESALLSPQGFESTTFEADFDAAPVILSQVQTNNGTDFVTTRQMSATQEGFDITMQEEEALNAGDHASETVGWIAIEEGGGRFSSAQAGSTETATWAAGNVAGVTSATTTVNVDGAFAGPINAVAQIATFTGTDPSWARGSGSTATGFDVRIEEEASFDAELDHFSPETVGYFAFDAPILVEGYDDSLLV